MNCHLTRPCNHYSPSYSNTHRTWAMMCNHDVIINWCIILSLPSCLVLFASSTYLTLSPTLYSTWSRVCSVHSLWLPHRRFVGIKNQPTVCLSESCVGLICSFWPLRFWFLYYSLSLPYTRMRCPMRAITSTLPCDEPITSSCPVFRSLTRCRWRGMAIRLPSLRSTPSQMPSSCTKWMD